ncbi:transformer-2 protein homolog alpha isoform X1 [Phyllopteryx taeniolatus]|uniref:transformer-2 protein homolog alpha isoform X1 n=1 Tax=Phyllopteryx taeniolatus TaxID=161469 RepID=UPI002AD4B09D|nr:transformer-2 protein homolog alpha isoform X1 [Phyllopteryx taeniolatus]
MSDEGDHIRRGSRSPSKSEHGSPTQAKSESRSGSQSGSRASKHSESRSRSRSKSGSRSKHDSNRHASRSRSPSHRCRQRSRSLSNSPESRRRKSTSPMSNRSRQAERRSHETKEVNSYGSGADRANPDPSKCLGVFGLSLDTTARDLREVFSQYGPLSGVNVVFHQRSGRSRGFAFVYFERLEDSKQAMEQANGMKLDGRQIRVDYSITKRAHSPTPGIYMGKDIRDDGGGGGTWRGRGSFYNRGYDRGYERGYERSYERSYERNYDRGYDRSYDRGYDRGSDRGYDRGCDRGYDRGYDRYDRCDEYDYRYSRRHSPSPDYGRYRSSSWSRSYNPRRY